MRIPLQVQILAAPLEVHLEEKFPILLSVGEAPGN